MTELSAPFHWAWYVVLSSGVTLNVNAPPVVVCSVATTCFVVWPKGNAAIVTVSPARLLFTRPVIVTCVPNFTTGADTASDTTGAAPRTVIVPFRLGWRPSWYRNVPPPRNTWL